MNRFDLSQVVDHCDGKPARQKISISRTIREEIAYNIVYLLSDNNRCCSESCSGSSQDCDSDHLDENLKAVERVCEEDGEAPEDRTCALRTVNLVYAGFIRWSERLCAPSTAEENRVARRENPNERVCGRLRNGGRHWLWQRSNLIRRHCTDAKSSRLGPPARTGRIDGHMRGSSPSGEAMSALNRTVVLQCEYERRDGMNQVTVEAAACAETGWEKWAAVPMNHGERRASGDQDGCTRQNGDFVTAQIAADSSRRTQCKEAEAHSFLQCRQERAADDALLEYRRARSSTSEEAIWCAFEFSGQVIE